MNFQLFKGRAWLLLALSAQWCAAACGSAEERGAYTNNDRSLPTDPALANSKEDTGAATIAFEPASYTFPVLSQAKLSVRVTPPSGRSVTFALVGETLDASLESEQSAIDPFGIASVNLSTAS